MYDVVFTVFFATKNLLSSRLGLFLDMKEETSWDEKKEKNFVALWIEYLTCFKFPEDWRPTTKK